MCISSWTQILTFFSLRRNCRRKPFPHLKLLLKGRRRFNHFVCLSVGPSVRSFGFQLVCIFHCSLASTLRLFGKALLFINIRSPSSIPNPSSISNHSSIPNPSSISNPSSIPNPSSISNPLLQQPLLSRSSHTTAPAFSLLWSRETNGINNGLPLLIFTRLPAPLASWKI